MKKVKTIEVGASIFQENDRIAESNRRLLAREKVFCVNIMGSPGSGKTSVLEKTIKLLKAENIAAAVIEGDIKGSIDAEILGKLEIPVIQINTGGACHLDANMVKTGLSGLSLRTIDVLFIENVGNLVCPAEFRLGQDMNVIVSSIPEGEEKPLKYPLMFSISDICLLNKTDLLDYSSFDRDIFTSCLSDAAPYVKLLDISAKTGKGFQEWIKALLVSMPGFEFGKTLHGRVVVAGMGDRMKGDDGAGCEVALLLEKEFKCSPCIKVINAENAIENYIGTIEKFGPSLVIVVDAVDFGGEPGESRFLDFSKICDTTSSTHNFSLPLIAEHIKQNNGGECLLLGIQPETVEIKESLSDRVEKGISEAVSKIKDMIKQRDGR